MESRPPFIAPTAFNDATAALAGFMVNAHTLAKASFTATYGRP